jgi:hypothetical protein
MSLADDLLAQAQHLATREPRKPKDASLRRAVSSSYYALFHLLVDAATRVILPAKDKTLRGQLARSFTHQRMREAAQEVTTSSANGSKGWFQLGPTLPSADLRSVAQAFIDLQQARHDADYNLAQPFRRSHVQGHVATARDAFENWKRIQGSEEARLFLLALLLKARG